MTKETMLGIIVKHNDMCRFIDTLTDVKIPADALFRLMPISRKMAALGLALTHEARAMGIDAKCNMQGGNIIVLGDCSPTWEKEDHYDRPKNNSKGSD